MTAISDLEIFARVARTGNMSAAGRDMGLSPAVVSKRISQLEEKLGARLFQRTTRHLTLTETGAGYYKRVVDILNLCEEAEDFICRRNTKPRGVLKVAVPTAFSRLHIAPYIGEFLSRYPEIELDVQVTDAFVDIIREGFDLAIRVGELQDSSLVARRIASDTRVLCAAPSYVEKRGAPETPADLAGHNCLMGDSADTWILEGPNGEVHVRPIGSVRASSSEFVREMVLAGAGIAMLSTWDVGAALRNGSLRRLLPAYGGAVNGGVYAVYPSRDFVPAKVDVLIEFLTSLYSPVPYWENELNLGRLSGRDAMQVVAVRLGNVAGVAAAAR